MENTYDTYVNKYKALKGGALPPFNIAYFNRKFDEIKTSLINVMYHDSYCSTLLGRGKSGTVTAPNFDRVMGTMINDKKVYLPVAVKKTKEIGYLAVGTVGKINYISSDTGLAIEVIIYKFINELWLKKRSPHLPYMIGYSCCDEKDILPDTIITERHGLWYGVDFLKDVDTFAIEPIWGFVPNNITNMGTLQDLAQYLMLREKNDRVELHNGTKCNIIKLFDYFTVSIIHTCAVLMSNNIFPSDMHGKNIFVHWIDDESYLADENIKNTKYIYYKFDKKIIKMKTYGIILKIGDVGTFTIKANDNLIISGDKINIANNYEIIKTLMNPNYSIYEVIILLSWEFSRKMLDKMVLSKIIDKYPYNEIKGLAKKSLIKDFLSPADILNKYEKYFVDKIENDGNSLVVNSF